MKLFLISLSFFTRIPIPLKKSVSDQEFYKSMLLLPVDGAVIGLLLYLSIYILKYIEYLPLKALILVLLYFLITGGIHYDGLSDTIDGLFSGKEDKEILKVMKDPFNGTFGILAIILTILTFYIINLYIVKFSQFYLLFLYPIVGRIGAIELGAFFSPNIENQGLGYNFCQVDHPVIGIIYFILMIILLIFKINYYYLLSFGILLIVTILAGFYFTKKINGITGDLLGFIIEFDQIIFLLSVILLENQ